MLNDSQRWPTFLLPAALLLAGFAAFCVDLPLSLWCLNGNCPEWLHDLFEIIEPYGQFVGPALAVLAVHQLDPQRRWAVPRLIACAALAGTAANVVKLFLARARPYHFFPKDAAEVYQFPAGVDVWSTFLGPFPFGEFGSRGQSLLSAHTATAVGLTMGLLWLYPAGRRLFPALALLVACQRIESGAHFLSDVCFGAALGYLIATLCLRVGPLPRRFDAWEAVWRARDERKRGDKSAAR